MTRHKKQQHKQLQQKQQQQKDKGWYCKEHDVKYLCEICGYDSLHDKQKEMKYYFVSG